MKLDAMKAEWMKPNGLGRSRLMLLLGAGLMAIIFIVMIQYDSLSNDSWQQKVSDTLCPAPPNPVANMNITGPIQNASAGGANSTNLTPVKPASTDDDLKKANDTALKPPVRPYAYVTLLTETWQGKGEAPPYEQDYYFIAARLLVFQLLHDPPTKSPGRYPIVVMCTPDVTEEKMERLRKDGATVVPVDFIHAGEKWLTPAYLRWATQTTKLRAWEMTQYNKMFYLDSDIILRKPLDRVFEDKAAAWQSPKHDVPKVEDEPALPSQYLVAGIWETMREHHWPPHEDEIQAPDQFNGGFFLLGPSRQMFNYYTSILRLPNRFDSLEMDQGLFRYVHHREGNMPWQKLPQHFSVMWPTKEDLAANVDSLHTKWWEPEEAFPDLIYWKLELRWRMEGFYHGRDGYSIMGKKLSNIEDTVPEDTTGY